MTSAESVPEVDGFAPAGWAFDKVAEGIAKWVLGAVEFFVNGALDFLRTSAKPDVEAAWFAGPGSPTYTLRQWAGTPIPDLLIAETALSHELGIVHVDGDFERIAEVRPLVVRRLG